jgi:outer membrane lipoprotein SlyB
MTRIFAVAFVAAASLLLAGCPAGLGGKDYSRDQARTAQEVQMGVVESVRQVNIEGTKSPVGAAAGAVVGGAAGSTMGGGTGRVITTTVGALLGGVGGAAAEEAVTRQAGLEITVRLESGRMIAVTQAADEQFNVGERVRVLSDGYTTRVTH